MHFIRRNQTAAKTRGETEFQFNYQTISAFLLRLDIKAPRDQDQIGLIGKNRRRPIGWKGFTAQSKGTTGCEFFQNLRRMAAEAHDQCEGLTSSYRGFRASRVDQKNGEEEKRKRSPRQCHVALRHRDRQRASRRPPKRDRQPHTTVEDLKTPKPQKASEENSECD